LVVLVGAVAVRVALDRELLELRIVTHDAGDLVQQIERLGLDDRLVRLELDLLPDHDLILLDLDPLGLRRRWRRRRLGRRRWGRWRAVHDERGRIGECERTAARRACRRERERTQAATHDR
jgi:hypothetical protein